MGKFNFGEIDAKSNFGEFVPIAIKQGNPNIGKISRPILSMNKSTVRIGSFLGEKLIEDGYQFARFMYSRGLLAIQFLKNEEPDCVKMIVNKKQGTAITLAFTSVANYLSESTDAVNLESFNYQFDVKHDEGSVYYVDLSKPWSKRKKKK